MKKITGFCCIMMFFMASNAQNYRIQNARAFYTVTIPGMARSDENGNTINPEPVINRFIYMECKYNSKPKIDSVFYNGILFKASIADKEDTVLKIGIKNDTGYPVIFNPKKGNHIWKVYLEQQGTGKALAHDTIKKIIIKGRLDKVKFNYVITEEIQLSVPDSQ
jgi:nitrogen fixation protein FixH